MKEKINASSNFESSNDFQSGAEETALNLLEGFAEKAVTRDNYLLFSLTKITFGDKAKIIGFGMLGNVWIFNNVEESES